MLSVFNSKTLRSMRSVVAAIMCLALFYSFYTGWNPIHISLPNPKTSFKPVGTGNIDSISHAPASDDLSGTRTSIHNIPDKVWHSAKNYNLSEQQRKWVNSWTDIDRYSRQELLTDYSSETFVRTYYHQTRPDIVEVYESLSIPILRADLLRYLIILAEGGYWSDLDVTLEKSVAEWVPLQYKDQNIDMIVGLEFDLSYRGPGTEVASQFCNWVFAAQPSSRNLQVIVDSVINTLKGISNTNSVPISGITLEMLSDVVNVTGPKIMTIAILESLGKLLGRTVDDRDFSGIKYPKLVGDVLIMPGVSFAARQNGYPTDQGEALVTHHYEGSWKKADAEAKEKKKQKGQEQ
ncbi:hypothetical protein N7495_002687 [Penicillium taxi]|uniref:uncharacterized protein n=1 Tax=Penicillium taxi TaxID=168475 RepID=UPI002545587E|nr:uncharacterized protein N7495_002687 [Penicillium taxi]KAJ5902159.1 hypothetical protein N7495_002687 [Penicillium taxi]